MAEWLRRSSRNSSTNDIVGSNPGRDTFYNKLFTDYEPYDMVTHKLVHAHYDIAVRIGGLWLNKTQKIQPQLTISCKIIENFV